MVIPHIFHRKFGNVGLLAYLCGVKYNSILMCTFNLTMSDSLIETVRPTFKTTEAIGEWLQEQVTLLLQQVAARQQVCTQVTATAERKCDMSVFDCFSGEFGGNRDAHEIADELHDSRTFTRNITAL